MCVHQRVPVQAFFLDNGILVQMATATETTSISRGLSMDLEQGESCTCYPAVASISLQPSPLGAVYKRPAPAASLAIKWKCAHQQHQGIDRALVSGVRQEQPSPCRSCRGSEE